MVMGYTASRTRGEASPDVWKDTQPKSRKEDCAVIAEGEASGEAREAGAGHIPQAPQGRERLIGH